MSENLSAKQFNQATVTRVLKAAGEDRRRRGKTRKRTSWPVYHPGFDYSPVDENTTAVKWHDGGGGREREDIRDKHHENMLKALQSAGFQAVNVGDRIHIKHS